MSIMHDIIDTLQNGTEKGEKRWVDTKSGWIHYENDEKKRRETIIDIIKNVLCRTPSDRTPRTPSDRTHFTVVKKANGTIRAWRTEEALERLIVSVNDKMKNQYPVGDKTKEAVDLAVVDNDNAISHLIELKPWKSTNSPAYGFVEIIKNFLLGGSLQKLISLILLAPTEYYRRYYNPKSVENFIGTVHRFNKDNEVPFRLAYIDIAEKKVSSLIRGFADKSAKWEPVPEGHTEKFLKWNRINVADYPVDKEIREKLQIANWQYIEKPDDWPAKHTAKS